MSAPAFELRLLRKEDRSGFDCGVEALNLYLQTQARRDMKRRVSTCFVALHREAEQLAGFYTLSASQVPLTDLDPDWSRRLPLYPVVPAVLIGRLAVERRFAGQGLGAGMLLDAVGRVMASEIGAHLLVVEAKDAPAMGFYRHLGFREVPGAAGKMVVPLAQIVAALGG